jgi:hypothetical protein
MSPFPSAPVRRNKLILRGKLGQTIFMALLVGLIYLRIGTGPTSIQGRTGALFFLTVQCECGSCTQPV